MADGDNEGTAGSRLVLTTLGIGRRVLSAGPRTIPFSSISSLTVGPAPAPRSAYGLIVGLGLLLYGLASALASGAGLAGLAPAVVLVLLGLAVIGWRLIRRPDRTVYLVVSASDGSQTLFYGGPGLLERVRQIIAHKIDFADDVAAFTVDFERGLIETIEVGSVDPGLLVEPPARGGAGLARTNGRHAGGSPARDTGREPARRPGELAATHPAPIGQPPRGSSGGASGLTRIDYSQVIGDVATLRTYYAEDPTAGHIAARLDELERLMREGTPSPASRIRLRDVSADLAQIMASTPQWAQVFTHIARMTGM